MKLSDLKDVEFKVKPLVNAKEKFDDFEPIEIIDENENVLYQTGFREAHDKSLLHRFCRVLVLNDDGEMVLHVRGSIISDAGKLDASGGHLNVGETYVQAAIRELQEEMGITVTAEQLTEIGRIEDRDRPHVENMIGRVFVVHHNGPYTIEEGELETLKLLKPEHFTNFMEQNIERVSPKLIKAVQAWAHYASQL